MEKEIAAIKERLVRIETILEHMCAKGTGNIVIPVAAAVALVEAATSALRAFAGMS